MAKPKKKSSSKITGFTSQAAKDNAISSGRISASAAKSIPVERSSSSSSSSSRSSGGGGSSSSSNTVSYNSNTGQVLRQGESFVDNSTGKTYTQGQDFNAASYVADRSSSGSSGGSSSSPINIDSNPGQTLAPGTTYTYKGQTYTQPGASSAVTISKNLATGSSGTDVSNIQSLLGGVSVDGKYGPQTQAAVIAFQKANGLTPDGIVGPNTLAMLNSKKGATSTVPTPAFTDVSTGVPPVTPTYTPPPTTAETANNAYYQSLAQQAQTLQTKIDTEYKRQLDRIQKDKEISQNELQDMRSKEADAIGEQGKLAVEEKNKKLEQLETEQRRFDENYNMVQGLASQLTNLMTEGNALIASQKGVTGLGLIRNPRVTETINNLTAAAGIIEAGISVYNGQMSQAQNQLQAATSVITSAYGDQIDYYKSLTNFYESISADESAKLKILTANEQDFLNAKIGTLEASKKRVEDTSQAIQNAMMDPDTALAYASAGVTLNDSPEAIAQKLAKYGYSKELSEQSNEMAGNGYTALVSGSAPAGSTVVKITDSQGKVKTYYKKASGGSSGGNALSILDIQRYQEAFPNAGITAGDTEATANAKVNASSNPATQTKDLIQSIKDNGTSYNDVVKEINNDETITDKAGTIKIANEVYGVTATAPTASVQDDSDWFDDIANYLFGENFKSNI